MIKNLIFLIFSFFKYYYLRLINFIILRIRENIILYPIKLQIPSFIYYRKLEKVKMYNLKKNFYKDSFSERFLLDFGIIKTKIQDNWLLDSPDEEISYLPRRLFWLLYELTKVKNPNIELLNSYLYMFINYFNNLLLLKTCLHMFFLNAFLILIYLIGLK